MKTITVLIPAYNEEAVLPQLFARLKDLQKTIKKYRLELFINDGSSDDTLTMIQREAKKNSSIAYVNLSRNFGKEAGMLAGFDYAKGDAVVIIDADLQDPPELIPQMIELWEQGYDDVYARRRSRQGETWLKKKTSEWYYRILQKSTRIPIQHDTGDFRLLDRRCIETLRLLRESQRNTKALLLVTHDRYFLDRVCQTIVELDDRTAYTYRGNYAYYLEKRDERIATTNANIDRARNLYRKELDWMRRQPQARGHKSRSRKEAFYELEQQARRRTEERAARLNVKAGYIGSKIFEAEYVSKAFDDGVVILKDFYYNFSRFEKMGIVGNNGTGKTTFIRMLLGEVPPTSGRFVIGETVKFGYFSQEGMPVDEQMKVIDVVRRVAETVDLGGGRHLTAMQFLNHFLFPPARQQDYVYKLSGGERRRLQLCLVLMQAPNFLILDEPTNDLDIATLQLLEEYLADFRGCVIVVSHDRYFMDRVVDHLLVFRGQGEVEDFPGNYSQYREFRELKEKEEVREQRDRNSAAEGRKPVLEGSDRKRKLTFKEKQEYEALGRDIEALEAEKAQLHEALASGQLSVEEITAHSKRLPLLDEELDEKSMRWLELSEWA